MAASLIYHVAAVIAQTLATNVSHLAIGIEVGPVNWFRMDFHLVGVGDLQ